MSREPKTATELRMLMEREEAMRHKEPSYSPTWDEIVNPPAIIGTSPEYIASDGWSNTQLPISAIPKVNDYEKWYKEMKQELNDLRKSHDTLMKLLQEVLRK